MTNGQEIIHSVKSFKKLIIIILDDHQSINHIISFTMAFFWGKPTASAVISENVVSEESKKALAFFDSTLPAGDEESKKTKAFFGSTLPAGDEESKKAKPFFGSTLPAGDELDLLPTYEEPQEKSTDTKIPIILTIKEKKESIKKLCEEGLVEEIKSLIEEVKHMICPYDYEEYLMITLQYQKPDVCACILSYDFYPLDFKMIRDIILLACKTGNCSLFDLSHKKGRNEAYFMYMLFAVRFNQPGLLKHIYYEFSLNLLKIIPFLYPCRWVIGKPSTFPR